MTFPKVALSFCTIALAIAGAASTYHVTISERAWVGDKELKPGDYTLQIEGDKAVMKTGKDVIETPAKVETASKKYPNTSLIMANDGGKTKIEEIELGGTTTKIVLK